MTHGPVQKWYLPFYSKLDGRKPISRTVFVCLAVTVGLGCGLFSYWLCGLQSPKLLLTRTTKLSVKTDQAKEGLIRDAYVVPREKTEFKIEVLDNLAAHANVPEVSKEKTDVKIKVLENVAAPAEVPIVSWEKTEFKLEAIDKPAAPAKVPDAVKGKREAFVETGVDETDTRHPKSVAYRKVASVNVEIEDDYESDEDVEGNGVTENEDVFESDTRPSTEGNYITVEDEYSSTEDKGTGVFNGLASNDGTAGVQWDDPRLDIMHMAKSEFNSKFKNPCWYEPLRGPDPYRNNAYLLYSPNARRVLGKLTEQWEELYEDEAAPKRLRCLPYFMIIGQPKCGSTDLFWKVAKHPDIDTPPIKELHWWARNRQGRRFSYSQIIPIEDYVDMFDKAAVQIDQRVYNQSMTAGDMVPDTQIITGEASVSVLWDNNDWTKLPDNAGVTEPLHVNPHYVHHIIPDVKLIVILRDPVERMYSDYLYFHESSKSADHFHKAVTYAIDTYHNCTRDHGIRHCVYSLTTANRARIRLRVGLYSVFLKDWFSVFPQQQFYILRLEDYSKDSLKHIKEVYRFLGVRDITADEEELILDSPISNVRKTEDKQLGGMHEATRKLLTDFYKPYNIELAKMLQNKKYLWLDRRR